jgi:hypothetical protein
MWSAPDPLFPSLSSALTPPVLTYATQVFKGILPFLFRQRFCKFRFRQVRVYAEVRLPFGREPLEQLVPRDPQRPRGLEPLSAAADGIIPVGAAGIVHADTKEIENRFRHSVDTVENDLAEIAHFSRGVLKRI